MIDRAFYARHREHIASRLPTRSNFFEVLDDDHRMRMLAFDTRWAGHDKARITDRSREFVNECFASAARIVRPSLRSKYVPKSAKARSRSIYAIRLASGATIRDFRNCDIFDGVLPPSDTHVPTLLSEDGPRADFRSDLADGFRHMFLHAPQTTSYIFLHEMFVGFFGYRAKYPNLAPPVRGDFRAVETSTWAPPARFVLELAQLLSVEPEDFACLHFCSSHVWERRLPQSVRDLALIASHIYWYLEVALVRMSRAKMTHAVNLLLNFFCFPTLDRIAAVRDVAMVQRAGRLVDELFVERIFNRNSDQRSCDVEAIKILCELERRVWRS